MKIKKNKKRNKNKKNKKKKNRLRAVPIFPLEFVESWKDIANASARKPRQEKIREARKNTDCRQPIV